MSANNNMLNILSNMNKLQGGPGVPIEESNSKVVLNAENKILEALSRMDEACKKKKCNEEDMGQEECDDPKKKNEACKKDEACNKEEACKKNEKCGDKEEACKKDEACKKNEGCKGKECDPEDEMDDEDMDEKKCGKKKKCNEEVEVEATEDNVNEAVEVTEENVNEAKIIEPEQEVGDVNIPNGQVGDVDGEQAILDSEVQKPQDAMEDEVEDELMVRGNIYQCKACGAFHQLAECPVCGVHRSEFFGEVIDCAEAEGQDECECEEIFVTMGNALGKVVMTNEAMDKVVRGGKLVKVKVRTVKKKLSPDQKLALAKAQKKSHTASANKARNKSMQVRAKKIGENVEQVVVTESAQSDVKLGVHLISENYGIIDKLAESLGFKFSKLNKSFIRRIGECKLVLDEAEGDMEGTVIYAKDRSGSYLSESVLCDLLEEAELNIDEALESVDMNEDMDEAKKRPEDAEDPFGKKEKTSDEYDDDYWDEVEADFGKPRPKPVKKTPKNGKK